MKDFLVLASRRKIALARMEKPAVNAETFFPPPTEFFHFPMPGKVFLQRKGRTRTSKDFMLQHHDARTPATVGPKTTEPHSTATALTRARARTPVTEVPTIEETPAKVWVLAKACTVARAWTPTIA